MPTTLSQLWNGRLEPVKQLENPETSNLENLMQRNLTDLKKVLKGNAIDYVERYTDCVNEYIYVIGEQAFCDGFCLATKLLTEALHDL